MPNAKELVARVERLTTLPAVYLRVKRVIDDPAGSVGRLAEVMSSDPAMTARVLRVVNSPFYGYPGRIETVSRAVNILGLQQVHDLVLAWAVATAFAGVKASGLAMDRFWRGSVARAVAARLLARRAGFIDPERLFVEGLLSDIGHLVMYLHVSDLAVRALENSHATGRPLHEAEREIVGSDYAQVGAELVAAWGLPQTFEEPIRCQVEPSAASVHPLEAAILHVATAAAEALDGHADLRCAPAATAILRLDDAALDELRTRLRQEQGPVVAAFFPQLAAA